MVTSVKSELNSLNLESIIKMGIDYDVTEIRKKFLAQFESLRPIEEILNSSDFRELIKNSNNEFSSDSRGQDWAKNAQGNGLIVRREGVTDLLKLTNPDGNLNFSSDFIIADLLAGNGFINQVANDLIPPDKRPQFINSDISYFMYKDCLKNGLFSIWQDAENPFWLKDNSVNAVIFAYGSHHINNRLQAVQEAKRILKSEGRLVLHDFEKKGSVDQWFRDVVSIYATPHPYPHFTKDEMLSLAKRAGLRNITIQYIDDPFKITANTQEDALQMLGEYAINLYGLKKLKGDISQGKRILFGINCNSCFV